MKRRDCSDSKRFLHGIFTIPVEAYVEYFKIDDLIMLRRTHPGFAGKLCLIAKPVIELFAPMIGIIDYSNVPRQFPKAKLAVGKRQSGITCSQNLNVLGNITSLDCTGRSIMVVDLSVMTGLTSLCLDQCDAIKTEWLDAMTKLVSLNLADNNQIKGVTLRKLTNLRHLNLDSNTTITDLDIEGLPLCSLSLAHNTTISPFVIRRLNLTQLNIDRYGTGEFTAETSLWTTITDLHINIGDRWRLKNREETIAKMTWLRRLTITDSFPHIDCVKSLTNLTYLELKDATVGEIVGITPLLLLQTLIIKGQKNVRHLIDFPVGPFNDLTHLEIIDYDVIFNFDFLTNLTHLDIECVPPMDYGKLCKLKNLTKLILRISSLWTYIDISGLRSLISLEVLGRGIVRSFVGNDSLQSLKMDITNCILDDSSLVLMRNLRHLSLGIFSCEKVIGTCFRSLDKLFSVEISVRNKLGEECIADLEKRGVMVRYLKYIEGSSYRAIEANFMH
ncbi:MAG: hypothetical protein Harvfovirus9_14 [Harvfovirus sp.]|uniref:Leucine-rich repeat protein n=1 Tax=Harvfovirus sp. TaxID=2487768 RepID=A0A3G5A306_9VIRU|nr:MAG: hypothetical protein Harvfovirus9_14 [Harvfovirus sp.]